MNSGRPGAGGIRAYDCHDPDALKDACPVLVGRGSGNSLLLPDNSLSAPDSPRRFHFVVPVWGESYVSIFLSHVLPSHLALGNLPSLPSNRVCYWIITDNAGAVLIRQSPLFRKLQHYADEVVFRSIEDIKIPQISNSSPITYTYARMTACHKIVITSANTEDSAVIFLNADMVYSDGTFRVMFDHVNSGARTIEHVCFRTSKESIPTLLNSFIKTNGELSISPRKIITIGLANFHWIAETHLWNGPQKLLNPSNLYWPVDDEGIIAHCTHFHPLLIFPRIKSSLFTNSIDHDYIDQAGILESERYIVRNSDEFASIEISPQSHNEHMPEFRPRSIVEVARFLHQLCRPIHAKNLVTSVHLYAKEPSIRKWKEVDCQAQRTVSKILLVLSILEVLPVKWTKKFLKWISSR